MTFPNARPTTYKGIPMRSRLEARYAAELDGVEGITWEYEPRAFADETGQYLPDFRLTQHTPPTNITMYVEVKPTIEAAMRALVRMHVILASDQRCLLLCVVPGAGHYGRFADQPSWWWRPVP